MNIRIMVNKYMKPDADPILVVSPAQNERLNSNVPLVEPLSCPECGMVGVHEWKCSRSWAPANAEAEK